MIKARLGNYYSRRPVAGAGRSLPQDGVRGHGPRPSGCLLFMSSATVCRAPGIARRSPSRTRKPKCAEVPVPGHGGVTEGEIWPGPVTTDFGWPPPEESTRPQQAFNSTPRDLGAALRDAIDEFDAITPAAAAAVPRTG
jgi:hypothetical protein